MTNTIIYLVTTLVTYVAGLISKKLKLNEKLPIQIQNILIAFISFVIIVLINKVENVEFSAQELFESIMIAIGGVGTAALAYDTTKINTK